MSRPQSDAVTQRELIAAVREGSITVAMLVASVALWHAGSAELAATALGGALAYALPGGGRRVPVPALVLGVGAGALVSAMTAGG